MHGSKKMPLRAHSAHITVVVGIYSALQLQQLLPLPEYLEVRGY